MTAEGVDTWRVDPHVTDGHANPTVIDADPWVPFSNRVALAALSAAGLVLLVEGPTTTNGAVLAAGVVAMVLLERYPITFERGRAGRLYFTATEVGFAFVATWSSARVVVGAVAVATVPLLFDRRLLWWKRRLASCTIVLSAAVGALVIHSAGDVPVPPAVVVLASGAFALTSTAITSAATRVVREPARGVARITTNLGIALGLGLGCGAVGWVSASAAGAHSPAPVLGVFVLGVAVLVCILMNRGAERTDSLRSTVSALATLGTVDDPRRLHHHLRSEAPALVRGASSLALVRDRPPGDSAAVPRRGGLWLSVERHPAADPLPETERERVTMIAALVADSLDRIDRLHDARQAAETDPLTGAFNRRGLGTMLDALLGEAALVSLDLDDLKAINDLGGHDAGDAAIVALTTRLRERLRSGDLLARTGGDEFLVVMPNTTTEDADSIIDLALTPPPSILIHGSARDVTASRGLALFDPSAGSLDGVLKSADEALYEAKRRR